MGIHRFSDIVLKRGVQGVEMPPARVFGLAHQAIGLGNQFIEIERFWGAVVFAHEPA